MKKNIVIATWIGFGICFGRRSGSALIMWSRRRTWRGLWVVDWHGNKQPEANVQTVHYRQTRISLTLHLDSVILRVLCGVAPGVCCGPSDDGFKSMRR